MINLAIEKNLKLTVGHDAVFNHAERRMRKLILNGYLGGSPVHMESYYCYDLGDSCKIAEHLTVDKPTIIAHGFTSPQLRKLNETEIIDELRVIINANDCTTAYFTFSSQMKPTLHQFRIYGPKNAIIVDHNHQTCIKMRGMNYTSYLDKFVPPIILAKQYAANTINNVNHFLKNDFHMKSGMKFLIESLYRSVAYDTPPPIPYREIILTSRIMDSIFTQIRSEKPHSTTSQTEAP